MRSVSVRLADLERCTIPIGFVDENLHTQVRFDCKKMFDEYPAALPSLAVSPPEGSTYPAIVTKDGDYVVWDVTASDCASDGNGEIQLTFVVGEIVAKSYVGRIRVTRSLNPSGEIPDPVQDWITQANAVLAEIPETIDSALEAAKESGEFDGPQGPQGERGQKGDPGDDYVLTQQDREEIAEEAAKKIDLSELEEDVTEVKSALPDKADKSDTVLETTLSRGRKPGTTPGSASFAFGGNVEASGIYSAAFGINTVANKEAAVAEGLGTKATGSHARAEGLYTEANHANQHVFGQYNIPDPSTANATLNGNYVEIVGNGTSSQAKSNARTLDWSGNEELAGDLKVFAGTNNETSVSELKSKISVLEPAATSSDVGKFLKAKTVSGGKVTEYEFGSGGGGGGLSSETAELLYNILKAGVYTSDQSSNLDDLAEAFHIVIISQSGSTLTLANVANITSVTQDDTTLLCA